MDDRPREMPIANVIQLVPPPAQPVDVGTVADWEHAEAQMGLTLPSDYRAFIFAYGSGLFANLYRIYTPFSDSPYRSLLQQSVAISDMNRQSQQRFPERFPYPYYPDRGGLLPWGNDENGNDYFWLTEGPPDSWAVVQDENRGTGIRVQPYSLSGFLLAILEKRVEPLASEYPRKRDYRFTPSKR